MSIYGMLFGVNSAAPVLLATLDAIKPFADLIHTTDGPIPTERLSLANWHELVNAYDA